MNQRTSQKAPGVFFDDTSAEAHEKAESAYREAEECAWRQLIGMDLDYQCRKLGAERTASGKIALSYFCWPVSVDVEARKIVFAETGEQVPIWERILVLHYLSAEPEVDPEPELIDFKHVPSGGFYYNAYQARTKVPLARVFGSRPELLFEAGKKLGGTPAEYGDAAVRLYPFPQVPVIAVLYAGDDEFEPDANILYESTVSSYFCTEDIAVLGGQVAGRLVAEARKLAG